MKEMYSPELERLIENCLADGVLTEQEQQILVKKAIEEGVDLSELQVYLQQRMQQKQMQEQEKFQQMQMEQQLKIQQMQMEQQLKMQQMQMEREAQIQKEREAKIQELAEAEKKAKGRTCPFCSHPLPLLVDKCPNPQCGKIVTAEASAELIEIIDKLEDALVELKSGNDYKKAKANVDKYIRRAKMYYESNPKVQKLLVEISQETEEAEKKAKNSARKQSVAGVFKGIGSFIVNHKILSIIIIWFLVGAVVAICSGGSEEDTYTEQLEWYEVNRNTAREDVTAICLELDDFIDNGDIKSAVRKLERLSILDLHGTDYVVQIYDPIFLKVIRELVENSDFSGAESLALSYKSRINNDLSWEKSACYTYLKSKFKANDIDFSMLKSKYDYSRN